MPFRGIHLNVQETIAAGGPAIESPRAPWAPSPYSPTTRKIAFRFAVFAQDAPAGLLVVDDDDIHQCVDQSRRAKPSRAWVVR